MAGGIPGGALGEEVASAVEACGHVDAASEVPTYTSERENELEAVLEPEREERGARTLPARSRVPIPVPVRSDFRGVVWVIIFLADRGRLILTEFSLAYLVSTCLCEPKLKYL